ncbi:hypothetical protein NDK43_11785 [Neobacillus pocheonensis]|uniref:Uncharacterized protein n=1 Tax=Neobacillus pocheonensis TaxID=363869 RepID=A0ABT0WBP4_9BACI|nr:hypothetical protein [Neobacillus pocheonensis]
MDDTGKIKLEKLLKENKIKQARRQIVEDLMKYHDIDISEKESVDYQISEEVHKKVYKRIKADEVKTSTFPYNAETLKLKIDFLFDNYKNYENETVLFYPSTFGFYFRRSNQFYLEYPISISLPLIECKRIILKLMLEMHDDLIVVSE